MSLHRLKGSLCYLVGPMDEVPDAGADWREYISKFLWSLNMGVLNPCNKPTIDPIYNEDPVWRENLRFNKQLGNWKVLQKLVEPVVSIDLRMIDLCSCVIMNVDKSVHMCGSYNEQTHACLQRKPVIVHCGSGVTDVPNWLFGIARPEIFFDSWKKIKEYLIHIDTAEKVDDLNRWKFFDYNKIYNQKVF